MNDTIYIILVLLIAFGIIFSVAKILDNRKKSTLKIDSTRPLGSVSRLVRWLSYGIIAMAVLFVIGAFILKQVFFAVLARDLVYLYIFSGIVYRIIKPRGI